MWSVGQRIHIEFLENQEFIVVKHMEGGMGDVYKIAEPNFAGFFSIKTLKHSMNAIDFKNECEFFVTASLHSSCVTPVGYGLIDSHPAIAYPWYKSSLADHDSKTWSAFEIENLLSDLMGFFDYACSELKILHCDIKPSNILLDCNNRPFVTDFGISKMLEKSELLVTSHPAAGTREYMAPELFFTNRQNVKSELYSFGITIYEFLTSEHPYLNDLPSEQASKKITKNFKILKKRLGRSMECYLDYIESCIAIESAKRPENFRLVKSPKFLIQRQTGQGTGPLIDSIAMQASYYRKESNYSMAEQILLNALKVYGKDPVLLNALGATYSFSKSREASIVPFEEAVKIIFENNCSDDTLLYLDPILNLSVQYRCTGRHRDAFQVLNRAWKIFIKQEKFILLYAEFGWMMIYDGNFLGACAFMEECFAKRSIQPFEMLCFTEAAWICGKIEKYADSILSKVIYNQQFDDIYFICAFLLSNYATSQSIGRMETMLDSGLRDRIENCEKQSGLSVKGLRPPKNEVTEAMVICTIDQCVTSGKYKDLILNRIL